MHGLVLDRLLCFQPYGNSFGPSSSDKSQLKKEAFMDFVWGEINTDSQVWLVWRGLLINMLDTGRVSLFARKAQVKSQKVTDVTM